MATVCRACGASLSSRQLVCGQCGVPITAAAAAKTLSPTVSLAANEGTVRLGAGHAALRIEDGAQPWTVQLTQSPMQIGRAPQAEIRIVSPIVSTMHARIEPNGEGHCIIDLDSTNGLLCQGFRLTPQKPQPLRHGDVIRIGDPSVGSYVTLTYDNPLVAPVSAVPPVNLPPPGQTLMLGRVHGGGTWKNPQLSRDHASIETLGDGRHLLRDLGSTNGTFVNGQRIQQQALQVGDLVQIGPFKLHYDGTRLAQQDLRNAMRIEASDLTVVRPDPGAKLVPRLLALLRLRPFPQKTILNGVSLCIEPGEFVALVGGSGAGKSTLMGALSGFARATRGAITVNGDNFYANFDAYRPILGYVPQDDIVHRPLPVTRALRYAARLRLSADMNEGDIARRVDEVLGDVEMSIHRAKKVEHLSGGQRKRVSIASELLADPALFFLDEPTSGLDPGLEKKMMYTLRKLADRGRTIVLVTHATGNIDQCSLVAFLSAGRLVYYGPPAEAGPFFGVGKDDFADIYTRLEGAYDPSVPAHAQNPILAPRHQEWRQAHPGAGAEPLLAELWELHFKGSPQFTKYVVARLGSQGSTQASVTPPARQASRNATGLRQFLLLTRRYLDLTLQDTRNLAILLAQAPIIAALLAFVAKPEALSGAEATFASARPVLFMLATVAIWFGIINAAREITKEVPVYQRERLAGLKVWPYIFSKVVVLALLVLFQSVVLLGIVTTKVALPTDGLLLQIGWDMFVTTFLAALAGLALGLLISTVAATPDRAISIVPLALIPQIVLSGVIFKLEGAAKVLSWLAIGRWAMDAYGAIIDLNALPHLAGAPPISPAYDEYTHEPQHLALRWLIMLAYTAVCLGLTMWLLQRKDRPNR